MSLMSTVLLWASLAAPAHAGMADDLALATRSELPEAARMEAFERLVRDGTNDLGLLRSVALDPEGDARQRWVCVRALGKVGGDGARQILVTLLDDEMPAMRAAATQAAGDLGDRALVPQINQKLKDPAVIVRAAAAEALGQLGDPASVEPLASALAARDNFYRGSSLWVRRHYVDALGQIGSRRAIPALMRGLDDADPAVVSASVSAFGQVAGFSFAEGRDETQQREAWRRWAQSQ